MREGSAMSELPEVWDVVTATQHRVDRLAIEIYHSIDEDFGLRLSEVRSAVMACDPEWDDAGCHSAIALAVKLSETNPNIPLADLLRNARRLETAH